MCGIVGCISAEGDVSSFLLSSLQRLEYRGYDSAGVALLQTDAIRTVREVGKLENLRESLSQNPISGRMGLAHTRWATHGRPSEANAHPHRDETGAIVVVHNGIIENFRELRDELESSGCILTSDTDSEVVAHLIARCFEGDLAEAVRRAVTRLEGAYALGIMHAECPDVLVACKKDSPLIIGVAEDSNILASDVPAVIDRTNQIIYLQDGEIAELKCDTLRITDEAGNVLARDPVTINWTVAQAERGGFPHFMLKEIHEQPTVISDTLLGRLDEEADDVQFEMDALTSESLSCIERIHIIACGTSWHAGQVGKFYLEKTSRLPVQVDYASEFRYRDPILARNCLVVAISQSGETADTLAAMRMAVKSDASVIGVCNVVGSTLEREAAGTILTHAGPEIGVASTKAFTSQLVALYLLSVRLGRASGELPRGESRQMLRSIRRLPHAVEEVLSQEESIRKIARSYVSARDFLFIGRGVNYPIALEGALKLKEISYIHAEGYPAGEMKHGPIALIDKHLPLVAICTKSATYEKVISNVEEARVRDAHVIAIATSGDERVHRFAEDVIEVPDLGEALSPIINVVPLQLLSYFIARERGCDVDQPRNLAKSVTVE